MSTSAAEADGGDDRDSDDDQDHEREIERQAPVAARRGSRRPPTTTRPIGQCDDEHDPGPQEALRARRASDLARDRREVERRDRAVVERIDARRRASGPRRRGRGPSPSHVPTTRSRATTASIA